MPDENPNSERLRVFISYARRDMETTDRFVAALEGEGFDVTIDRRDLPYGEEWQNELADFIHGSDTVVWLVSEQSVQSRWCNWELGEVQRLNKRLVPVAIERVAPEALPEGLGRIQVLPAEGAFDFERHMPALVATLNADRAWVKEHTRLADRARQWVSRGRAPALLLRGIALSDAQRWADRKPAKAPPPSDEVLALLLASRKAQGQRQRLAVVVSLVVAVIGLGLAGLAYWQRGVAVAQRSLAERNEARAVEQQERAEQNLQQSLLSSADVALGRGKDADAIQLSLAAMGIPQSEKARGRGQAIIADAMAGMPPNSIHKFQGTPVSVDVSVDRRLFAVALAEGGVQILNRNSGDVVGRHDAGSRPFLGVTFSADGEALLFQDATDQTVMHWRWRTGQPQTLGKLKGAASFARSPTGDAFYGTATFDPAVFAWDQGTGAALRKGVLKEHEWWESTGTLIMRVRKTLEVTGDGKRLLVGGDLGLSVYDAASFELERNSYGLHDKDKLAEIEPIWITDMAFLEEGAFVAAGTSAGKIHIYELKTLDLAQTIDVSSNSLTIAESSKDGRLLLASNANALIVYDMEYPSGAPLLRIQGHDNVVGAAWFDEASGEVISAALDGTVRVWPAPRARKVLGNRAGQSFAFSLFGRKPVYAANERFIVYQQEYEQLAVYSKEERRLLDQVPLDLTADRLVWGDGKLFAIRNSSSEFEIRRIAIPSGDEEARETIEATALSSTRTGFVAIKESGEIGFYDFSLQLKRTVQSQVADPLVDAISVSPDERFGVIGSSAHQRIVDLESGRQRVDHGYAQDTVVSTGGEVFALNKETNGNTIEIWTWDGLVPKHILRYSEDGENFLDALTLSPGGRWLALTFREDEIRIIDTSSGREVFQFKPPSVNERFEQGTARLAFLPDDARLLLLDDLGNLSVFLIDKSQRLAQFPLQGVRTRLAGFSADADHLYTVSSEGVLSVHEARHVPSGEDLLTLACRWSKNTPLIGLAADITGLEPRKACQYPIER